MKTDILYMFAYIILLITTYNYSTNSSLLFYNHKLISLILMQIFWPHVVALSGSFYSHPRQSADFIDFDKASIEVLIL